MATSMDSIIRGPGSPISPRSIFMVSKFQNEDLPHLANKFPSMNKAPVEATIVAPETEEVKHQSIPFHESSPCYRKFKATSSDADYILRTVLPFEPSRAEHVYKATMDDIFVHNLGLQQADSDLFEGYMLGRRVVVARMSPNEFGVFCTDEAHSNEFLMALRSMNVQVQDA